MAPKAQARGKGKAKAKGGGRESPKADWCFTVNNPTPADVAQLWDNTLFYYLIMGDEYGAEGTPHL